jgi:hypothetical protein
MIDNTSLATFQRLYLTEYGEVLPEAEARELGERLVNLYRAVYLPKRYFNKEREYAEDN